MRNLIKIALLVLTSFFANAQQNLSDSLRAAFRNAPNDSVKYLRSVDLAVYFQRVNVDTADYYAEAGIMLAQRNNKKLDEAASLADLGKGVASKGEYARSLEIFLKAFSIAENAESEKNGMWWTYKIKTASYTRIRTLMYIHAMYSTLMVNIENSDQEIFHLQEAKRIAKEIGDSSEVMHSSALLGKAYLKVNRLDSALLFEEQAKSMLSELKPIAGVLESESYLSRIDWVLGYLSRIDWVLGDIHLANKNKLRARQLYYEGIQSAKDKNSQAFLALNALRLSQYYLAENEKDSALFYAKMFQRSFQKLGAVSDLDLNLGIVYEDLFLAYKLRNQIDSAYKYQGLALITKDSLYKIRIKNLADFQNLSFGEQLRLKEIEKANTAYQNKIRTYAMLGGFSVILFVALVLYGNNRQKLKANKVLEKTLSNLKSTQSQLIQSEKMASLGELTAGIAHEIQNPLNFVNNFSEVNTELIDELKKELAVGNRQLAEEIADDVRANSEKINHHGKRADAIVKGMLQHSRSSSGVKEPTDINALCDEYLRLTYHGLRAKDKSFNAKFETDFDNSIGKVNVISQDIGRVVLNLLTNAFYTVNERANNKQLTTNNQLYEPTVTVATKKHGDKIEIRITDNGNGIPQKVLAKIFQPFFTTKPTGQGTGLGLSLSYDIMTKGHGGELKVETFSM